MSKAPSSALPAQAELPPWKVLVVERDPAVQSAVQQALADLRHLGRPVQCLTAASAVEARLLLGEVHDVAVALIDPAMETERAGLDLVTHIRQRLQDGTMRILLHTGPPGPAATRLLMAHGGVNGCVERGGSEGHRLQAAVLTALRSHAEVQALQRSIDLLQARSVTDQLTGLNNCSTLRPTLTRALGSSQRRGETLTVVFLDVDDFKLINDRQGHLRGDEVLRTVGAALLANSRMEDSCFRYGGDEFLVLLPNCSVAQMEANYLPRLQAAFAALGLRVSHGAADAGPLHYPAADELIRRADERMYACKRARRRADTGAARIPTEAHAMSIDTPQAERITIYHNPACGTSRNVLALIRHAGVEPEVIEYLKTPPSKDTLRTLVAAMGGGVRPLLREKGTPYQALRLDEPHWTDDQLLDFIVQHPILMNRPVVVSPRGTALCRPSEAVLPLLPAGRLPPFTKEDGELVHDDGERRG